MYLYCCLSLECPLFVIAIIRSSCHRKRNFARGSPSPCQILLVSEPEAPPHPQSTSAGLINKPTRGNSAANSRKRDYHISSLSSTSFAIADMICRGLPEDSTIVDDAKSIMTIRCKGRNSAHLFLSFKCHFDESEQIFDASSYLEVPGHI